MSLLQAYPSAEGFLSTPADPAQVRAVLARLDTGDELGPFRITGLIGAGGMGEVYRAWDTRLDRDVAIKVVPQASSIDGAARERFEAEARAISRLTHPRISTLYDVGSASIGSATVHYLVMELVDGETLAARLRRGALPLDEALAIAIDIAEALAAAHAAGVVHRDVKPANIMLTRSGAKLLDFGLARLRPSPMAAASAHLTPGDPATQRTGLLGTLPYMAPELLRGAGTDARTDLFAFGAVLYEMLTGSAAFAAESEADLVAAILEGEPPPIATRQPLTPPTLAGLMATCLAKDPQDRWQTSHDLVRALRWIRDTIARGPRLRRRRRAWCPGGPGMGRAGRRGSMGALAIAAWKRRSQQGLYLPGVCHRGHSVSARDGGTGGRAGRQRARVRRDWVHGHATVVAETIRRGRQPSPRRDRWCCQPFLVARRALDCVRRARQALEDRTDRRPAAGRVRGAVLYARHLESGRHDSVQRLQSVNLPGFQERRDGEPRHGPRSVARRCRPSFCIPARRTAVRYSRSEAATVSRTSCRAHSIRPRTGGWRRRKPTWGSRAGI
jgi:hypothetical protein